MRRALIVFALVLLGGAVHAQDYSTAEYCDPWCLQYRNSAPDCTYRTYAQCEVSSRGAGGNCVSNPFIGLCSRGKATQQPVHKSKRVH
jgi:hypothetical protein